MNALQPDPVQPRLHGPIWRDTRRWLTVEHVSHDLWRSPVFSVQGDELTNRLLPGLPSAEQLRARRELLGALSLRAGLVPERLEIEEILSLASRAGPEEREWQLIGQWARLANARRTQARANLRALETRLPPGPGVTGAWMGNAAAPLEAALALRSGHELYGARLLGDPAAEGLRSSRDCSPHWRHLLLISGLDPQDSRRPVPAHIRPAMLELERRWHSGQLGPGVISTLPVTPD